MDRSPPVFVVGPSRSGTTLLRSILNLHPLVGVATETHYFDDLRPRLEAPAAELTPEDRRRCVDYFLPLFDQPYGHGGDPSASPVSAERLLEVAAAAGGSADAVFEAFCRVEAGLAQGAGPTPVDGRWGEKTPRHVFRVDDMFEAFPDARVLAIVRDPRAVVASYAAWWSDGPDEELGPDRREALQEEIRRAQRSFHPVIAATLCRGAVHAAEEALRTHGADRVRIVRYEDLTAEPERTVREICSWLGIDFASPMLEAPLVNSSFSPGKEAAGVRRDTAERWRSVLGPAQIRSVEVVCGGMNRRWGYAPSPTGASPLAVAAVLASAPLVAVRAAAANQDRIASLPDYVRRRVLPGRRNSGR